MTQKDLGQIVPILCAKDVIKLQWFKGRLCKLFLVPMLL